MLYDYFTNTDILYRIARELLLDYHNRPHYFIKRK